MALNLGNSFGSSLSVGVYRIKLNNLTKYVELPVECLRTRVQFPPPPPTIPPAGFNAVLVTAFFFGFTPFHSPARYYKIRLHPSVFVIPAKAGIQCFQSTGHRPSPVRRIFRCALKKRNPHGAQILRDAWGCCWLDNSERILNHEPFFNCPFYHPPYHPPYHCSQHHAACCCLPCSRSSKNSGARAQATVRISGC